MKKIIPILLSLFALGVTLMPLNSSYKEEGVKASTQIVETFAYNEMVGLVSSVSGNDITPDNSGNTLVTYGFRHGDVASDNLEKFTTYKDNLLGVMDSTNSAFFSNWRMGTSSSDAGVIFFKAEKKIYLEVERKKLGADWRDGIDLSIYRNDELLSSKTLSDTDTTSSDFTYKVLLDEGDTLYWQIKFAGTGEFRHISMDAGGADWNTLPTFSAKEFVQLREDNITPSSMIETLTTTSGGITSSTNGLVDYKVYSGSIKTNTLVDPTLFNDKVGTDNSYISSENIVISGKNTLSIYIKANYLCSISVSYLQGNLTSFKLNAYQYLSSKYGLKMMYDLTSFDKAEGTFVLRSGEYLYLEYTSIIDEVNEMPSIENISVYELARIDDVKADYPLYNPTDYSSYTKLTHKEIAFESARIACNPINTKEYSVQLLSGDVKEDLGENLSPFSYIEYDDGQYVGKVTPIHMLMTAGGTTFDGSGYAAVSDYRIKTSVAGGVVYKLSAKVDTQIQITHKATDGGWIDEAGQTYFRGMQYNGEVYKTIETINVVNSVNAQDTFKMTFNMASGDTAYYIFGSSIALERNLNIAPDFTSVVDEYDEDARDEIFGVTSLEIQNYDVVTDVINNNYEPVNYKDTMSITLAHGDVENIALFDNHTGAGKGNFDDALITNNGNDSDAQFKRWQMHAGMLNDNAIMVFTALKDLKVSFLHTPAGALYNEGASMKYYLSDTDGFIEYKEERYITKDTPENYYGYTAHLRANQSIIIEYTSNDENGYAVLELPWYIQALTDEFDETLVNDYTNARDIQNYKNDKIDLLDDYVYFLDREAYSVSNYALIESYVDTFKKEVKKLNNKDDIDDLYNETIDKIDKVLTIQEENIKLEEVRNAARSEAQEYMNKDKHLFTASEWKEAEKLYADFDNEISSMLSETNIKLSLQSFKNAFDLLPRTQEQQTQMIIIISCVSGAVLLLAGATITIILIKKRKAK